jgi:hypothetical protein
MPDLFPEGLTQKEFTLLSRCSKEATNLSPDELLDLAANHLANIRKESASNSFINLKLATAILNNFKIITETWGAFSAHCQPWLKGMIRYFVLSSDLESDFTSPIGFDDDVEIMNACLRMANREDLCLQSEDFDDV